MSELRHSEQINELTKALAAARKKFKPIKKESVNPFFAKKDERGKVIAGKYADLSAIIEATESALAEHELVIVQSPRMEAEGITVTTMLLHGSGQWMRDDLTLPIAKKDAQGAGASITYARRYACGAFLNVAAEPDDDGNSASGKGKSKDVDVVDGAEYEQDFDKRTEGQRVVGDYQVRAWESAAQKGCRSQGQIAAYFKKIGISEISHMHRQDFNDAIKWLLNPKIEADLTETLKESVEAVKANGNGKKPVHNFPKLFAEAKGKGIPETDVKQYAYETFQIETLNDLSPLQFKQLQEWVGLMA